MIESTNPTLPVSGFAPFSPNMTISKTSLKKIDPPARSSIEPDIKPIEGYKNVQEQGMPMPIGRERPIIDKKKPSIGKRIGGPKTNETLNKILSPAIQSPPSQGSSWG
jgi:hypothetical protein